MKITIVGNGSIGRRHLKGLSYLKDELGIKEIRAFDKDPMRIELVKDEIPNVSCYDNLTQAVDGADTIFLCVPTSLHIPIYETIKSLGSFNYFIEKPLSHTLAGCEQMIFDQEKQSKHVAVGYMLHFHPVLLRAKSILDKGTLGRVISVRAECGVYLPLWHPWEDYRDFYMSWKTGGGGALLDISHEIDYLQWMFGDVEEVQGSVGTFSDLEISSDDLAVFIMKFKSGIIGQCQLDLLQFERSRYCKIIGTEGVMIADLANNEVKYNLKDNPKWVEEKINVDFEEVYRSQYRNVINAFKGGNGSYVSAKQAFKSMQVIEAVRRSQSYGTRVKLPLYD